MPRNGEEVRRRLQQAALELFRERGYDQTRAAEIAARAGVTERTFYRHFPDKREVLFSRSDELRAALVEKVLQAADVREPLRLVVGVLMEFDWEGLGPRELQLQRRAVIAANPELLERDLIKNRGVAVGLADALQHREVRADVAQLAAHVGAQIFAIAYNKWLSSDNETALAAISEEVMSLLATIVPDRGKPSTPEASFGVNSNERLN